MFDGGVINVTISQEIVVIVTPIISFSSTEKLLGNYKLKSQCYYKRNDHSC